jgi:F-type H+-transporting ATPase subunit a
MSDHYTFLNSYIENQEVQKYVWAVLLGLVFIIGAKRFGSLLATSESRKDLVVPSESFSLFSFIDMVCERFIKFHDSVLGVENRKHAPFVATVFFYLAVANLLGVIPGLPVITNSIWVNIGIALAVFIYFNYFGIREHGLINYIKHFAGPLSGYFALIVGPLVFCAEILSTCLRPFTLNLRLYWNIKGDHMVMEIIHNLLGNFAVPFALPLFVLAVFVSFMQAFVFSMLTMVYVQLATQHGEEH